jgi:hypothetical protein
MAATGETEVHDVGLGAGTHRSAVVPATLEDLGLEGFDEALEDSDYLNRVTALSFEGVTWNPERIRAVRDVLAPWHHNIKLDEGIYTAYCEDYYPSHAEIMRVIAHAFSGDFAAKRILDIGCGEGYFST